MALYCFDSWFLKKTLFAVCEMTKPTRKKRRSTAYLLHVTNPPKGNKNNLLCGKMNDYIVIVLSSRMVVFLVIHQLYSYFFVGCLIFIKYLSICCSLNDLKQRALPCL